MTPDKFLTDLAALHECQSVSVIWRGYFPEAIRFEVTLSKQDANAPHCWMQAYGEGPTVEAAMQNARAKLAAHYAGEAA